MRFWAGFYLALYLFIAVPVNTWHHCRQAHNNTCQICDHHYDPYIHPPLRTAGSIFFTLHQTRYAALTTQLCNIALPLLSNKSPPVFH